MHLISRGLICLEKRPRWSRYLILSKHCTTVPSSRKFPFLALSRICFQDSKEPFVEILCLILLRFLLLDNRPECCIICLVYINRLIAFTEIPLQATNWRPLVLCSLLVAQKVWDDRYLSNADFAFIYPFFKTDQLNKLEKKFLELI